jgi:hypothetical protein
MSSAGLIGYPGVVASGLVTGATGAIANVCTYTTPTNGVFRCTMGVEAISGTWGDIFGYVTFTDIHGNVFNNFGMVGLSPSNTAFYTVEPLVFHAMAGTSIVVSTNVTGATNPVYDFSGIIERVA